MIFCSNVSLETGHGLKHTSGTIGLVYIVQAHQYFQLYRGNSLKVGSIHCRKNAASVRRVPVC